MGYINKELYFSVLLLTVVTLCFQNCGEGFEVNQDELGNLTITSNSSGNTSVPTITPTTTPTPTVSPTPLPTVIPTPTPSPTMTPTPSPSPSPTPMPRITPTPSPTPADDIVQVPLPSLSPQPAADPNKVVEVGDYNGGAELDGSNFVAARGWGSWRDFNGFTRLTTTETNAFVEYRVKFRQAGTYLISPYAASPSADGSVRLIIDGETNPTNYEKSKDYKSIKQGRSTLYHDAQAGQEIRVRLEANDDLLFSLWMIRVVWVKDRLDGFENIHQLNANGTVSLPLFEISNLYRIGVADFMGQKAWGYPWTYGNVEYTVYAPVAGEYSLQTEFSVGTSANLAVYDVYIDDVIGPQAILEGIKGAPLAPSPVVKFYLSAGVHRIRIQNANKVNNTFASGFILGSVSISKMP